MTIRYPYKDPQKGGRWTLDVDPRDKVNYVGDVRRWCRDSATTVASFVVEPTDVLVLEQGIPQGPLNALLPVKLDILFSEGAEPNLVFYVRTTDGQDFVETMWFKKVQK